jgi:hypothetical protein
MLKFILKPLIISLIFLISQINACQELEAPKSPDLELAIKLTAHLEKAFELLKKDVYSKEARELVNLAAQSQHPPIIELQEILTIWDAVHQEVPQSVSSKTNSAKLQQNVGQLACKFNKALQNNDRKFLEIIKYIFLTELTNKLDQHQLEQLKFNLIDQSIDGFHFVLADINESQASISQELINKIASATEEYTNLHPQDIFINNTQRTSKILAIYHFVKIKTCIQAMDSANDFSDLPGCLEQLGNLILISQDAKDFYLKTNCHDLITRVEQKLSSARLSQEKRANIYSTLANIQIYFGNIPKAIEILEKNHELPSSKFNLGALLLQDKSRNPEKAISLIEDAALLGDANALVFIANKFSIFKTSAQIKPEHLVTSLKRKIGEFEKKALECAHENQKFMAADWGLLEEFDDSSSVGSLESSLASLADRVTSTPELRKLKCALGLFIMENECWTNPRNRVTASQAKQLLAEAAQCPIIELSHYEITAKTHLAKLLMNEGKFRECQNIVDEMTNPALSQNVQAEFRKLQTELNLRQLSGFKYYEDAKIKAALKYRDDAITNLACAERHNFPNTFMLNWLWKVHGFVDVTKCQEVDEHKKMQLLLAQLIPAAKKTKDILTEQNLPNNEDLDKMILMAEKNVDQFSLKLTDQKSHDLIAKAKGQLAILKK